MIRLALALLLFFGVVLSEIAHARETGTGSPPAAPSTPAEVVPQPVLEPERAQAAPAFTPSTPRWTPRQQRRREEFGPRMTVYPTLIAPSGIPQLPF